MHPEVGQAGKGTDNLSTAAIAGVDGSVSRVAGEHPVGITEQISPIDEGKHDLPVTLEHQGPLLGYAGLVCVGVGDLAARAERAVQRAVGQITSNANLAIRATVEPASDDQ